MRAWQISLSAVALSLAFSAPLFAQPYGPPDRGKPGDEMIQGYLARETAEIHATYLQGIETADDWNAQRGKLKQQYLSMLGLWPMPEMTPLHAKITNTLRGDGFVVEMLHYQSRPQLYVTANLYRPATVEPGAKLPAVLYVCGHSGRGRNGNKTAFQSHGMWFARHGYVCLVVDTLQLGEIAAIHHGTYNEGRWWWHSRGYTSAGVECINGVRGIDYLVSRDDVDPERIAVTGISGGGAATFWVAAADERVKVAAPVSGMADLPSYVSNRVINGHCDCMFLHNTFAWPWTNIAALVAPRPMLFVNSDADRIFPMDANERVINRLERLYSLFGAGDSVDSVVSIGGHAYRQDIRQAVYRFINAHLKDDPRLVIDSEVDLVSGDRSDRIHPIDPEKLRVFPTDADIPRDELNTTIDQHFVPVASVQAPAGGRFAAWKEELLARLREMPFRYLPRRVPPARLIAPQSAESDLLETEDGISVWLQLQSTFKPTNKVERVLLIAENPAGEVPLPPWVHRAYRAGDIVYTCQPRGIGRTEWTRNDPPNYVERSHVLIGRTVDAGRVWDVAATARYLRDEHDAPVYVLGEGAAAVWAAYAALVEEDIAGVVVSNLPASHMESTSPQFLSVLRICDVPEVLGMLAPRPLTIDGAGELDTDKVDAIYRAAGASVNYAKE